LLTNPPLVSEIPRQLVLLFGGGQHILATLLGCLLAAIAVVVFVGIFVVVMLLSIFAVLLFGFVPVLVERRRIVVVVPSRVPRGVWLSLLLKQLRPIFLS
jgi:hypothetical protein